MKWATACWVTISKFHEILTASFISACVGCVPNFIVLNYSKYFSVMAV